MRLSDLSYALPPERIAQTPLRQRSDARLLVLDRAASGLRHTHVHALPELLRAGGQVGVAQSLELGLEAVDASDGGGVLADQPLVPTAEDAGEQVCHHGSGGR